MKEFVFGTAAQFDWLEALLADGRCHVFEHCVLPPGCTPGTARLGFEKNSSVYILYIDYGIKTTVQDAKFCSLLEQGEVRFVCMQDMVEFLYELQPLFGAAAPSAGAEPDRAQATPPVAEETPSEDDVVDMAAVLEQREKREQPQLVDPEKISGPLKKHVFGQDDALNDIAELVAVHKMRKKEKILDHCFIFQGQFFHFRPIYRNREVEDDLPDPVTVQLLFREQFDPLNERPHELLPLHLGGGFIDLIKRKQQAVNVVARNFLLSDIPYLALHIVNLDFDLIYSTILLVIATLQIRNFPVIIRVIHIQTVHLPFQAGFCA